MIENAKVRKQWDFMTRAGFDRVEYRETALASSLPPKPVSHLLPRFPWKSRQISGLRLLRQRPKAHTNLSGGRRLARPIHLRQSAAVDQSSRPSSPPLLSHKWQSPSRHAFDPPRLTLPKIHAPATQSRAETQCIESRWCPLGPAWAQRDRFRPWSRISIASSLPSSSS